MNEIYDKVLDAMDEGLLAFMGKVPKPQKKPFGNHFVYHYAEKRIDQAIILKLVRLISGLRTIRLLKEHGFIQEQMSLQRMIDEIVESVEFLSYAFLKDDITDLHKKYLEAFYREIDIESPKNRPSIPRSKLRRYITDMDRELYERMKSGESQQIDENDFHKRTITRVYSDVLHVAARPIMDLYYGKTQEFHTKGVVGTPRHEEQIQEFEHYLFRGIESFRFASVAFREYDVSRKLIVVSAPFRESYFSRS